MTDPYVARVRASRGPLLTLAHALCARRWYRPAILLYRLDRLLFRLGLV